MGMLTKIMVVVNLVLAIGVAALTFTLWAKQVNWVKEAEKAVNEHNKLKDENTTLARNLEDLKRQAADRLNVVESQLKAAMAERDGFSRENDTLKKRVADNDTALKAKDATLAANTQLLASQKATNDKLTKDVADVRSEADKVRQISQKAEKSAIQLASELQSSVDQIKDLMAQRVTLMQRVDALEGQVKRYQESFGVTPGVVAADSGPNLNGQILKIDGQLLAVNLGERAGARKGVVLTLSRGDKYLGKAVIREVQADLSVAAISEMTPDPQAIQVGDTAQTLY